MFTAIVVPKNRLGDRLGAGTSAVTPLSLQAFLLEQLGHPVFAAPLAQVTHVQGEFAVTVHPTAFQPGVFEQTQ
jgi:hypothetical protein